MAICNKYSTIFIDDIPVMSINEKNEARRFLSFIDSAYETKSNVYLLAGKNCRNHLTVGNFRLK